MSLPLILETLNSISSLSKIELDKILFQYDFDDDNENLQIRKNKNNSDIKRKVGLIEVPNGICYIQRDKAALHGKIIQIRRIFAEVVDSGDYKDVGWVAKCDVDNCRVKSPPPTLPNGNSIPTDTLWSWSSTNLSFLLSSIAINNLCLFYSYQVQLLMLVIQPNLLD